jgi:hypothetical protein
MFACNPSRSSLMYLIRLQRFLFEAQSLQLHSL